MAAKRHKRRKRAFDLSSADEPCCKKIYVSCEAFEVGTAERSFSLRYAHTAPCEIRLSSVVFSQHWSAFAVAIFGREPLVLESVAQLPLVGPTALGES